MEYFFGIDADEENGLFLVNLPNTYPWEKELEIRRCPYLQKDVIKRCYVGAFSSETLDFLNTLKDLNWSPAAEDVKKYIALRTVFRDRANKLKDYFLEHNAVLPQFDITAPFKTVPYTHQKVALVASLLQPGMALLMEMGTGKTKVSIDRACYELWKGNSKWYRMVIVAPKSILDNWEQEFEKHTWVPYNALVLRGTTNAKADDIIETFIPTSAELLKKHAKLLSAIIVNYEALDKLKYMFSVLRPNLVIFDETSQVKNPSAKRTKASLELRSFCEAGMILNGTAISKSPLDLWSQFELAEKGTLGFRSFNAYKNRYSFQIGRYQSEQQNIPELKAKVAQAAFIITKKDCLDLPERVYMRRNVEMTIEQKNAYTSLKEELVFEMRSYLKEHRDDNPAIMAQHILTQMLRLEQVTSGFIQDRRQGFKVHFTPNPKTVELNEMLESVGGKIIIWCRFVENILHLQENLNGSCAVLYGEVPTGDRQNIVNDFNETENKRILIGHPQVAGFGLNIVGTEQSPVNTVVRYSHDFNYTWVKQSDDRCHRVGMHSNKVTYVNLVVPNSIDTYILKNLAQKEQLAGEFKDPRTMQEVEDILDVFDEEM